MTTENATSQAHAQADNVAELFQAYTALNDGHADQYEYDGQPFEDADEVIERVNEEPLSIELSTGWVSYSEWGAFSGEWHGKSTQATAMRIVMCTGGPHVEIHADIDEHGQPEGATIHAQDWGTRLERVPMNSKQQAALDWFVSQFPVM